MIENLFQYLRVFLYNLFMQLINDDTTYFSFNKSKK